MIVGNNVNSTLDYVVNLHKKNSDYLGFIPKPYLKTLIENDQVFIQLDGGDNAGFIVAGSGNKNILRIYQACIEQDLRRLSFGKKLFKQVIDFGLKMDCESIYLRCRENLQSNLFWKAIGCNFLYLHKKITQRTKKGVNVWEYKLQEKKQFNLFE